MTPPPKDYRTIPLTQGQVALVDEKDYHDLVAFKWFAVWNEDRYYAVRHPAMVKGKRGSHISMHRQILGLRPGDVRKVDHKEPTKTLDNRRSNLRIATHAENMHNQKLSRVSTTGFKGVSFSKGKWVARIRENKMKKHLGRFTTPQAAHAAYCEAAVRLYGEFARTK
jgi:hypothetical protein